MDSWSIKSRAFVSGAICSSGVCAISLVSFALTVAGGIYVIDPAADTITLLAVAAGLVVLCGVTGGLAGQYGVVRGGAPSGMTGGLLGGGVLGLLPGSQAVMAMLEADWSALLPLAALTVLGPVACAAGGWIGAGRGRGHL